MPKSGAIIMIQDTIEKVLQWGKDKGITGDNGRGTLLGQVTKTQEEVQETRDAIIARSWCGIGGTSYEIEAQIKDGVGDATVTLILLADMMGWTLEECLDTAYAEIKGRTGKMVDGIFVKD
jgi:NTP pyrophosphatase (non-canonical NTP hydrolase)